MLGWVAASLACVVFPKGRQFSFSVFCVFRGLLFPAAVFFFGSSRAILKNPPRLSGSLRGVGPYGPEAARDYFLAVA